jgi:hypothetical protein
MNQVTLDDLLDEAQSREHQPVAMTNWLRNTAWLSIASFAIGLLAYNFLPSPEKVTSTKFLLVMDEWLAALIALAQQHQSEFVKINAATLVLAGILLIITQGFAHSRLIFQWMVFAVSFIGAANCLFMGVMASMVVINLLIWVLGVALILTILGLIIYFIVDRFF